LVNAIWQVRRENRRDLRSDVARLLEHEDPIVREEAISLLFVRWEEKGLRSQLMGLIRFDPDFGVRSRAAGALALLSNQATRREDIRVLSAVVLNREEDQEVRRACYEALYRVTNRRGVALSDETNLDEDIDLTWVRELHTS
jgi:HEAT repeat protein